MASIRFESSWELKCDTARGSTGFVNASYDAEHDRGSVSIQASYFSLEGVLELEEVLQKARLWVDEARRFAQSSEAINHLSRAGRHG